jgi:NADH-quinone oxidoreductase subunit I
MGLPLMPIFRGLRMTFSNLLRAPVTYEYPEVKRPVAERFRGRIHLNLDTCIGCSLCMQVCPNLSCTMQEHEYPSDKNKRKIFPQVEVAKCIYCGFCAEVCPTGAIYMSREFETARYDRREFHYTAAVLSRNEREVNPIAQLKGGLMVKAGTSRPKEPGA